MSKDLNLSFKFTIGLNFLCREIAIVQQAYVKLLSLSGFRILTLKYLEMIIRLARSFFKYLKKETPKFS